VNLTISKDNTFLHSYKKYLLNFTYTHFIYLYILCFHRLNIEKSCAGAYSSYSVHRSTIASLHVAS